MEIHNIDISHLQFIENTQTDKYDFHTFSSEKLNLEGVAQLISWYKENKFKQIFAKNKHTNEKILILLTLNITTFKYENEQSSKKYIYYEDKNEFYLNGNPITVKGYSNFIAMVQKFLSNENRENNLVLMEKET